MTGQGWDVPVVGVDLGGTKVVAGVVDSDHQILGRSKRPTPAQQGEAAILAAIRDAIAEAIEQSGLPPSEIAAIGVGSPGPLDTERGVILFSANMNVRDFALGPALSAAFGRPTLVQNDVRVGGYGELRLGAGRGYRSLLAAFVGTGIGGCVVLDGEIWTGATENAGEIGHIIIKANGPKCGCGRRGCMEALASRTAIARRIVKATRLGEPTVLSTRLTSKSDKLKSRDLAAAFSAGDLVTVREVERAAFYLGVGLASLVNVLSPEVVIVGGGVPGALGEPYLRSVRAAAEQYILFNPDGLMPIIPSALGDDAGLLGAALMAREAFARPRAVEVPSAS